MKVVGDWCGRWCDVMKRNGKYDKLIESIMEKIIKTKNIVIINMIQPVKTNEYDKSHEMSIKFEKKKMRTIQYT